MSRFGLVSKRCKAPDTSKLECLKKIYLNDGGTSCCVYSGHLQGIYIHVINNNKWYELHYKI